MKLTETQFWMLQRSKIGRGVFTLALDPSHRTMISLINNGLLSDKRDKHGYYRITPAGRRAALEASR